MLFFFIIIILLIYGVRVWFSYIKRRKVYWFFSFGFIILLIYFLLISYLTDFLLLNKLIEFLIGQISLLPKVEAAISTKRADIASIGNLNEMFNLYIVHSSEISDLELVNRVRETPLSLTVNNITGEAGFSIELCRIPEIKSFLLNKVHNFPGSSAIIDWVFDSFDLPIAEEFVNTKGQVVRCLFFKRPFAN